MKRPLLAVALCYSAGIVGEEFCVVPVAATLAVGFLLTFVAVVWRRSQPWLLPPSLVFAGMANLHFHAAALSPEDLRTITAEAATELHVRGILLESPTVRAQNFSGRQRTRSSVPLRVSAIRHGDQPWESASGVVQAATTGSLGPPFWAGAEVEVFGVLALPDGPRAPGLFDYREYLRKLGIHRSLRTESTNEWRWIGKQSSPPLADRFVAWGQAMLARGLPAEDEPLRLLWAMTLGWKAGLTPEASEAFMRSGTMHIFAISGLHIALLAGILVAALRVLRVPRGSCGLLVIPLIWSYTYVTGWQASAIRSTVMMTVIIVGWSLRRPSDLINSLAASALIILLFDPAQAFQASFQLSFFVVLSLALFGPVLDQLRRRLVPATDPWIPRTYVSRWQRLRDQGVEALAASFTTSLAAWLGSIPLVAYYFHFLTPVSLLANLLVVPLSSAALASNLASLTLGVPAPWLAEIFNHGAWLWMRWMILISEWAARLPGGCLPVRAPSLLGFLLYYALLLTLMTGVWRLNQWRLRLVAGLAAVIALWAAETIRDRSLATVSVIAFHGGHVAFIHPAWARENLLVDCGNAANAQTLVKPFLQADGIRRLDDFVLTHGDLQHVGGAAWTAQEFGAQRCWASPLPARSPAYRRVLNELRSRPEGMHTAARGTRIGPWTVLHPAPEDAFSNADDGAIVLRGEVNGVTILLLSDLGRAGQDKLVERTANLRADIVITGLPARSEPVADALLEAAHARLLIVADSTWPATARASRAVRRRLGASRVPVIYLSEVDSVVCALRDSEWKTNIPRTSEGADDAARDAESPGEPAP